MVTIQTLVESIKHAQKQWMSDENIRKWAIEKGVKENLIDLAFRKIQVDKEGQKQKKKILIGGGILVIIFILFLL